jgi:hypothetical protein
VTDTHSDLEPIQVGEFELSPTDLFSIARSYIDGDSAEEIAERLDLDIDDLAELLAHPEVFDRAIDARRQLIRLMVYGPLTDRLVTIASGAGDTRSQVSAIKFLRELSENSGKTEDKTGPSTSVTHNTLTVIGQMPAGGFDAVVRQVEAAQEEIVLDVTPGGAS